MEWESFASEMICMFNGVKHHIFSYCKRVARWLLLLVNVVLCIASTPNDPKICLTTKHAYTHTQGWAKFFDYILQMLFDRRVVVWHIIDICEPGIPVPCLFNHAALDCEWKWRVCMLQTQIWSKQPHQENRLTLLVCNDSKTVDFIRRWMYFSYQINSSV